MGKSWQHLLSFDPRCTTRSFSHRDTFDRVWTEPHVWEMMTDRNLDGNLGFHTDDAASTRREARNGLDHFGVIVRSPFRAKHLVAVRYRHRQPNVPVPTLPPSPHVCPTPPPCLSPHGPNWIGHISASNEDGALMLSSYERSLKALSEIHNLVAMQTLLQQPWVQKGKNVKKLLFLAWFLVKIGCRPACVKTPNSICFHLRHPTRKKTTDTDPSDSLSRQGSYEPNFIAFSPVLASGVWISVKEPL